MATVDQISLSEARKLYAAWVESLSSIKGEVVIDQIEVLIAAGDIDGVLKLLGIDSTAFLPMETSIANSFLLSATLTAGVVGSIPEPSGLGRFAFRFDVRNPAAEAWLRNHSSKLITEIIEDQHKMVREQLSTAISEGRNPRQSALDLVGRLNNVTRKREGGFIGLTQQQAQWVENARNELIDLDSSYFERELRDKRFDASVRKAIDAGEPLTQKKVSDIINRLQARTLKFRGDTIARNESVIALRTGQYQSFQQAIQKGEVAPKDAAKEWDASGDGKTRPDHARMEGKKVPFNKPFILPDGSKMMFSGDTSLGAPAKQIIQCRCRTKYKIDFAGKTVRMLGFR